jgi:hypothetical protein
MNNGAKLRSLTNEELAEVLINLDNIAIYSGGENNRLLNKDLYEDFLCWLNKENDWLDDAIFKVDIAAEECYRCSSCCGKYIRCVNEEEKRAMEVYDLMHPY